MWLLLKELLSEITIEIDSTEINKHDLGQIDVIFRTLKFYWNLHPSWLEAGNACLLIKMVVVARILRYNRNGVNYSLYYVLDNRNEKIHFHDF